MFGYLPANQLSALHVGALQRAWRDRTAQWTQRTNTSTLRRLLRHIAAITGNAEIKIKLPRPGKQRTRIATDEERARLWTAASAELKFCLLCWTELGLRFREPLRIKPEDIDAEHRTVSVLTKGDKHINLPVPRKLEEFLAAIGPFDNGVPIVTQIHGTPANPQAYIREQWLQARRKAGIATDLRIHDLRRTLATRLYRATLDPKIVQQALGHENLSTTSNYLAPLETPELRAKLESITWRWKQ